MFVYILKSKKSNRNYTGHTADLENRLKEHNRGKSSYDKLNAPFELVYYEKVKTRAEAMRREKYFKTGKGRDEIKAKLEGH